VSSVGCEPQSTVDVAHEVGERPAAGNDQHVRLTAGGVRDLPQHRVEPVGMRQQGTADLHDKGRAQAEVPRLKSM